MVDATGPVQDNNNDEVHEKGALSKIALFLLEIVKVALLAGITIALVRYFLFKPFYVKGQSMEPTFFENDYLIIDEISYRFHEPQRGDIIVLHSPVSSDNYLKRIVGLPGERVKIEDTKVIIYNNEYPRGLVLGEQYLNDPTTGSISVALGPDEYYVLGDNRGASFDSRRFGPIKRSAIVGRVWFRGWPFTRITTFVDPSYVPTASSSATPS
jgi:signal peptidase I